jgi:tellurite resistance protein
VNIDTRTIRRLRDALLDSGRLSASGGTGASEAAKNRVAPFVETMFLVMVADGHDDDDEVAVLRGAMRTLAGDSLTDADFDLLLRHCRMQVEAQGVEARLQAIGQRISGDRIERETGFSLAAAVALADDRVAAEESSLLAAIAEWYGLSARRSQEILEQFDQRA